MSLRPTRGIIRPDQEMDEMPIESVGICLKDDQPQAEGMVVELGRWLKARGIEVHADSQCADWVGVASQTRKEVAAAAEMVIALGGDGTLLSVARAVGPRRVPILGVNLGRLGFLAEVDPEELYPVLEESLAGKAEMVRRMRLEVRLEREGKEILQILALNEAVVTHGQLPRLIDVEACLARVRCRPWSMPRLKARIPTRGHPRAKTADGSTRSGCTR